MRIQRDIKLDFKDVLIIPKRSTLGSRSEVELEKTYTFRNSKNSWTGIPIMVSNMDTTGNFEVAKVMAPKKIITCIDKHFGIEKWEEFAKENSHLFPHIAVSTGTTEKDLSQLKAILSKFDIGFICIDVANGYTENYISFVSNARKTYPKKNIIAGNVTTPEMVEQLLISGADVIKIGIGSGSVCTTRLKTGIGYPQLSAVIECADAAHGLGGHIVSDGGCSVPGDVSKAFGGGADFVMLGGMFAGHAESGGDLTEVGGKQFKKFYGMASKDSLTKYFDGDKSYRTHEGKVVTLPYRGPIENTVIDLLGGLRSTCTYVGAKTLKELPKRTTFVRCSMQANRVYSQFDAGN